MEEQEFEVDIAELISVVVKKWWVIAVSFMICVVFAFSASELLITPKYTAKGSLYVSGSKMSTTELSYNQTLLAQSLVNTYREILKSNTALTIVSQDLGGKYTTTELEDMISFSSVDETEVLYVSVSCADPHDAYLIAQSILKNAPGLLTDIVNGGEVKVIDEAQEPIEPSSPNVKKNTALGALVGIIIGLAIIVLSELFGAYVKSEDAITSKYGVPVLGTVPRFGED